VTVERGARIDSFEQHSDGITAMVSGPNRRQVKAGWLLGCDGASSTVRKAIGASFEGSTFEQPWVVADVFVDPVDEGQPLIEFTCDPGRPIVTMPMPGGRRRWEFMLLPGESHEAMLKPSRLDQLIRDSGWSGSYEVERAVIYTFHARMASRWNQGRVFLLGDAAHVMPPFAGQGMNSGIRDAGNIWWKIAAVERGAAGPVLLDSFEQERRDHVKQMIDLAVRLGGIIQTAKPGVAKLRDTVIKSVMVMPGVRSWTLRLGWKPDSVIRTGWMVGGRRRARSLVGTQLAAAQVKTPNGTAALDEVIGARFAIISKAPDPWAALDPQTRAMLKKFGAAAVTLSSKPAGDVIAVTGDSAALRTWIKRARGGTVVVRPDRFVYGVLS
jgi:3-(3-hydroxy-phenyl)propionate hydroxylase